MSLFRPLSTVSHDDAEYRNRVASWAHTLATMPLYVPIQQAGVLVPVNYDTAWTWHIVMVHWEERSRGNPGVFTPSGEARSSER